MTLLRQYVTNFSSGELSPLLSSRLDAQAYKNGAFRLRNVRLRSQGGVTRRPGLRYHQTISNLTYQTEAYIYDEDEAYILLFSAGELRIIDDSNPTVILDTIGSCPWTANEIGQLVVTQTGDTMFIAHPNFMIRRLTRQTASSFSLSNFVFDSSDGMVFQPYFKFAPGSVSVTPSTTSGTNVNLTASAPSFSADYVGLHIKLIDSAGNERHFQVTGYTSDTVLVGTLSGGLANTQAIVSWAEPVLSTPRGFARTVQFHDQRFIIGGSKDLPNFLFMSKVAEFFNFDLGNGSDSDAIQIQIAENQVSEIKAMQSFRFLTIFTSEQELYVPTSENRPLAPSTITVKKQTGFGSGTVQPEEFDGAIVFLTKSKGAVREFVFSDISQAYNADSITLLSEHLIGTPLEIEAQREAPDQMESYLYLVNAEGTLPVFMSIRKETLQGWARYETNGLFKSIVNVNRKMYCVIERTINGATVTSLEQFDNSFHLDMATKQTNSTAQKTWTVSHLPNTAVKIKSGNYSLGEFTTNSSGQITLVDGVKEVEIGLSYTPEITTLPPETQLQDGITVGQKRRIVRTVLDIVSTLNVKAQGTKILVRSVTDDFSLEPQPITRREEVFMLGWNLLGRVTITQDEPLPLTLNGVMLEVEV